MNTKFFSTISICLALFVVGHLNAETAAPTDLSMDKPGIVLTFDDSKHLEAWAKLVPLFKKYGAKATFFLDRTDRIGEKQKEWMKQLAGIGCEMACHGLNHKNAPELLKNEGAAAFLEKEITPAVEAMTKLGYPPTNFAYPGNGRNEQTDEALKKHFAFVRAGGGSCNRPLNQNNAIFIPVGEMKNRFVLAGVSFDGITCENVARFIGPGLERAKEKREIIVFYAHRTVETVTDKYQVSEESLEEILKLAKSNDLEFYTLQDLAKTKSRD